MVIPSFILLKVSCLVSDNRQIANLHGLQYAEKAQEKAVLEGESDSICELYKIAPTLFLRLTTMANSLFVLLILTIPIRLHPDDGLRPRSMPAVY